MISPLVLKRSLAIRRQYPSFVVGRVCLQLGVYFAIITMLKFASVDRLKLQ